jgi:hypothetical protein
MVSYFQDEGVQVPDDQGAGDLPQPAQGPGQGRVVHITLCRNIDGYARSWIRIRPFISVVAKKDSVIRIG